MSRQLKPNEWIELFQIYETSNLQNVWIKYANYKKITNSIKNSFKLRQLYTILHKLFLIKN